VRIRRTRLDTAKEYVDRNKGTIHGYSVT